MGRKRIVIDFDKSRRGGESRAGGMSAMRTPRRRGLARLLLVIAVILVVVVGGALAGAYFWWRSYQNSPGYSLALLAEASQRNDSATIDTILDTDKITDDFVSQVRQRTSGSYSSAITSVLPSQLNSAAASLTPKLKETVHDEVVKELHRLTEPAGGKPFILVALAVPRLADVKQENEIAYASVNIKDERVQLTMQSGGDRWRVTAIQDDRLAKSIADGITRNLPSPGAQFQDEVRKQLDKLKPRER